MKKNTFDFSNEEIGKTIQKEKQNEQLEQEEITYEMSLEAIVAVNENIAEFRKEISTFILSLDSKLKEMHKANTVTISEDRKQYVEQEGNELYDKVIQRFKSEANHVVNNIRLELSRVVLPNVVFYCMIIAIFLQFAFFAIIVYANYSIFHLEEVWKLVAIFTTVFILAMALTICTNKKFFGGK